MASGTARATALEIASETAPETATGHVTPGVLTIKRGGYTHHPTMPSNQATLELCERKTRDTWRRQGKMPRTHLTIDCVSDRQLQSYTDTSAEA